ncbi:MAG: homocysteine S-methyltransferase family protein [bacterium]|nr:homocysteine S-methyltransferase family protein [bacterium]
MIEVDRNGRARALRRRLQSDAPVLLDGATGTELERRGHPSQLPLWSTGALLHAPEAVETIHRHYVEAGAEIITANTFRTQSRVLAGSETTQGRALELSKTAVALARNAAALQPEQVWVAGSAPPLEDCYLPERVPGPGALEKEHHEHASNLARAGVDLILVETMNCIAEACAAAKAAHETDLPFFSSFICDQTGRLLSSERLEDAIEAVEEYGPEIVLVNCLPPSAVAGCLPALVASGRAFGVYANLGAPYPNSPDRRVEDHDPSAYVKQAEQWIAAGARVVGGCCGTTPAHIRALREAFPILRP